MVKPKDEIIVTMQPHAAGSCVHVRVPYARIGVGCCYGQGLRKKNSGHAVRVTGSCSSSNASSSHHLR
jgi:hypothetical protein